MFAWQIVLIFFVFMPFAYQEAVGDANDEDFTKTEDLSGELGIAGRNQSEVEEGSPDSHEAMNNRELKPKLTIGNRRKRSYEFLVGLVKRNASLYQVTKDGKTTTATDVDMKASEVLLELLVKIAANPQQWTKVHELLQKIDNDLINSKKLVDNLKKSSTIDENSGFANTKADVISNPPQYATTKYPWQQVAPPSIVSKEHRVPPAGGSTLHNQQNFAYHRVTGNPLTHSKNPKAYIAVSVIAPKPQSEVNGNSAPAAIYNERTLEDELKELKPWSHEQNLKNMADLRTRWVIDTERKPLYAR